MREMPNVQRATCNQIHMYEYFSTGKAKWVARHSESHVGMAWLCTVRHSCCDGTNSTQTTHSLWHGRHAGEVTLAPVCGPTWQHDSKFLTYYCQILPAMLDVTPKSFSFLIASDVSLPVCSLTPLFLATCATLFFCRCHPLSAFSILEFSLL